MSAAVLHRVHRAAASDADLLRRFLAGRDEAAFAAVVERHGPMVLGVCRAVLRDRHDAEDAFQTTFLTLARTAASIRRPESVAAWLHGVACRVALRARSHRRKRLQCEEKGANPEAVAASDDLAWSEVRAALHEELAALPDALRGPLALCYLQGLTRDEAATRLGVGAVTLKGRLQRGRELLRRRLERRGIELGTALAALSLAGEATALPKPLVLASVAAALAAPPVVRMKALFALLLVAVVAAAGGALVPGAAPPQEPPAAAAQAAPSRVDAFGDPLPEGAVARLGTMRFNHGDGLNSLHFSGDGATVVSEGGGFVRVWDAATGKERHTFAVDKPDWGDETILSTDAKTLTLLRQGWDKDALTVWDVATGQARQRTSLPIRRKEMSIYRRNALSPDGRLVAQHTEKTVQIVDTTTGKERFALPQVGREIRAVLFAADTVVSVDTKHRAEVRDATTGRLLRQFAVAGPAYKVVASADGRRLAVIEEDLEHDGPPQIQNSVSVWDLETGKKLLSDTSPPRTWYRGLLLAPKGDRLFSFLWQSERAESVARLWDVATGRKLAEVAGAAGQTMALSPDGARLALGGLLGKFDVWDLQAGRLTASGEGGETFHATAFWAAAADRVVTVGPRSVVTWDAATGQRLRSVAVPPFGARDPQPTQSPDGRFALTFVGDHAKADAILWDVATGRRLHTLSPSGHSTAFSPDGSLLAMSTPEKNLVRLWDVKTGRELRSFGDGGAGWPGRVAFADAGKTLLVVGKRTTAVEVATGKPLFSWRLPPVKDTSGITIVAGNGPPADPDERNPFRGVAVSPDGTLLAGILDPGFGRDKLAARIALCDARTGKVLRLWGDSGEPSRGYEVLAFSADGRQLATSDGFIVHVWETATGKKIRSLNGHRGEFWSLAFDRSGRRLVSASWDSTALIWDLVPPRGADGDFASWWDDLAGNDAARGRAAVWRFADTPGGVAFLAARLKPVTEADIKEAQKHIAALDDDDFATRTAATAALERLGPVAVPELRRAAAGKPSAEAKKRIDDLLDRLTRPVDRGEALRTERAVAALEYAGTTEARRVLQTLAR